MAISLVSSALLSQMWSYILCHDVWEVIIIYQKGKTLSVCLLERWKCNSSKWVEASQHRIQTYEGGQTFFQRNKIVRFFQVIDTVFFSIFALKQICQCGCSGSG